jgi:hypothetical protein
MTGNFENLVEGGVYRLNGREYYATPSRKPPDSWELRTVAKNRLVYRIIWDGRTASIIFGGKPSGMTISDLEFVREAA